jgi:hypothetical protein
MSNDTPSHLTNTELTEALARLARSGRETTVCLVTHLAEFEARDLHLAAGFPSLFAYCTEVLRLSEHEAYHRILAARTARRHPRILAMLREGSLNLTTVRLVAPHLTDANADPLLGAAAGRSKRQVEELVARHAPRPDVPSSVRKLPVKTMSAGAMSVSSVATVTVPDKVASVGAPPAVAVAPPVTAPVRPAIVRPLAPERYEVRFTASAETCAKLRRAQDLLRHAVPTGDTATVVDRALTLLIEDLERKKFAITDRPRSSRGTTGSARKPPAHVRRAVSRRDVGRCAFVGTNGRRCETRAFLEFHHVIPYAMGGEATVENIQLRCRAHNGYEAGLFYGQGEHRDGGDSVREGPASYGKQLGPDRVRAGSAMHPSAPA